MTLICPKCGQTIDRENDVEGTYKDLLAELSRKRVIGLWSTMGYVTEDNLDKRKRFQIDAVTTDKIIEFLKIIEYDSLNGTEKE